MSTGQVVWIQNKALFSLLKYHFYKHITEQTEEKKLNVLMHLLNTLQNPMSLLQWESVPPAYANVPLCQRNMKPLEMIATYPDGLMQVPWQLWLLFTQTEFWQFDITKWIKNERAKMLKKQLHNCCELANVELNTAVVELEHLDFWALTRESHLLINENQLLQWAKLD